MRMILAIDPGTAQSAFMQWNGAMWEHGTVSNDELLVRLPDLSSGSNLVAIEMIASYGMPVGREVFDTCVWIGRFWSHCVAPVHLIYRKDIKMYLCGTPRAKDGNIRQALIDKYGAPGTRKQPGATYGISKHLLSALAIADYAMHNIALEKVKN